MTHREQIKQWLSEANMGYEEAELAKERVRWALVIEGHPFQTYLAEVTAPIEGLSMEMHLGVSDDHRATLASLDADQRDRFVYDLKLALLARPIGFTLDTEGGEIAFPTAVHLGLNLLEDPLTKAGFFRRHHQLQTSAVLAVTMFQKLHRFKAWR